MEYEESRHQAEFQASTCRDTLESSEEPEDDREQHVQNSKQYGWEDTLNDPNNRSRNFTQPSEPTVANAETMNVGNNTNESNRYRPEDDECRGSCVTDCHSDAFLIRVQTKVTPNDVLRGDFEVAIGHTVGLVVGESAVCQVCGELLVERDEGGIKRVVSLGR